MATALDPTTIQAPAAISPSPSPSSALAGEDLPERLDPRVALRRQFHEALRSRMNDHIDKDGSYFSYMFLDKLLNSTKKCVLCGSKESGKLPDADTSLELYVAETGVVGQQLLECTKCKRLYMVTSCDDPSEIPSDPRLAIRGMEIRHYCKRITHFEVLHDLMEMLHIAATEDGKLRRQKHAEVAEFMLRSARRVCEEWCKAEYVELRLKKYLRLREETLLTTYNPTFTPDCTDEFKEMYGMMADSFRKNRRKVLLLLALMKESLIDNPTRPSFMMWVSIAMMHSDNYHNFKAAYEPRAFMKVDSNEYQALKDRYLALDVPLGVKKIPVVFMLFEIPRFYHYVDFLSKRLGKKRPRTFLTDDDKAKLLVATEESKKLGLKRKPRSGKLVSAEAHLDMITRYQEMEREKVYQSYREKEKAKAKSKHRSAPKTGSAAPPPPAPAEPRYLAVIPREQAPRPLCMSKDDFKSMLYDHLKANEAGIASGRIPGLPSNFPPIPPAETQPRPTYVKYSSLELPLPPIPPPKVRPEETETSGTVSKKSGKKTPGAFEDPTKTVLVAQIDSAILRAQGYDISEEGIFSSVVASRNNIIEYILEGFPNPEEVKAFLSMKYQAMQKQIEEEAEAKKKAEEAKEASSDGTLSATPSDTDGSLSDASTTSTSSRKKRRARKKKKKKASNGDASPSMNSTDGPESQDAGNSGVSSNDTQSGGQPTRGVDEEQLPVDDAALTERDTESAAAAMDTLPNDTGDKPCGTAEEAKKQSPEDLQQQDISRATSQSSLGNGGSGEDDEMEKGDGGELSKSKKSARDKFKTCENCQLVIEERIQVCAGCKKVAYCNYRCQKAHWKVHKKSCSYALRKDTKDRTG